jgi:hypothetical protein
LIQALLTAVNVTRNVNPAGQIWAIADLDATVKADGEIKVKGKCA